METRSLPELMRERPAQDIQAAIDMSLAALPESDSAEVLRVLNKAYKGDRRAQEYYRTKFLSGCSETAAWSADELRMQAHEYVAKCEENSRKRVSMSVATLGGNRDLRRKYLKSSVLKLDPSPLMKIISDLEDGKFDSLSFSQLSKELERRVRSVGAMFRAEPEESKCLAADFAVTLLKGRILDDWLDIYPCGLTKAQRKQIVRTVGDPFSMPEAPIVSKAIEAQYALSDLFSKYEIEGDKRLAAINRYVHSSKSEAVAMQLEKEFEKARAEAKIENDRAESASSAIVERPTVSQEMPSLSDVRYKNPFEVTLEERFGNSFQMLSSSDRRRLVREFCKLIQGGGVAFDEVSLELMNGDWCGPAAALTEIREKYGRPSVTTICSEKTMDEPVRVAGNFAPEENRAVPREVEITTPAQIRLFLAAINNSRTSVTREDFNVLKKLYLGKKLESALRAGGITSEDYDSAIEHVILFRLAQGGAHIKIRQKNVAARYLGNLHRSVGDRIVEKCSKEGKITARSDLRRPDKVTEWVVVAPKLRLKYLCDTPAAAAFAQV